MKDFDMSNLERTPSKESIEGWERYRKALHKNLKDAKAKVKSAKTAEEKAKAKEEKAKAKAKWDEVKSAVYY